jgi:protocatechuate 3,4-dioxygenase beta subunit
MFAHVGKPCGSLPAANPIGRMIVPMHHTRREFLGLLLAGAAATRAFAAGALTPTPRQTAGPFYPVELPLDSDNDLVRVAGRPGIAKGVISNVYGRILDASGRPIPDARVEIWQCDANSKYHHAGDDSDAEPDENFQGFGATLADEEGRYRFRTIRPVDYPGRTAHIHFRVIAPSGAELTTQMYVRGHPTNEKDRIFRALGERREQALAEFVASTDDSAELMARFDLVLA